MTKSIKIITVGIVFGALELITFYAYSLIWLKEGQLEFHGDPVLQLLAWLCLLAMLIELVVFIFVIRRIISGQRDAVGNSQTGPR